MQLYEIHFRAKYEVSVSAGSKAMTCYKDDIDITNQHVLLYEIYSQTCVRQPPTGPGQTGCYIEVAVL